MLKRITLPGVELPRLYTAQDKKDAALAQESGIPYIIWTRSHDDLLKYLLRPTLEKMFPYIKWNSVLGKKPTFETDVKYQDPTNRTNCDITQTNKVIELSKHEMTSASVARDRRSFSNTTADTSTYKQCSLDEYMGDISSYINLDVLQQLQLMPAFIGDILDNIRTNITSPTRWREGYNKKLGATLGNFSRSSATPNLIILDISGSIPRGISATMLTLIDTLRTQVSADLIITASKSEFYPAHTSLPDPQILREWFGYGNESLQFFDILTTHIQNKHYGHVFSFGDYDEPSYYKKSQFKLTNTKVDYVHHYHTYKHDKTGYARWCRKLATQPLVEYNNTWCHIIKEDNDV